MTSELWVAVLSSSVITGILGAIFNGWFSLRSKQNDYANTYYKLVLDRRLVAYENVEQLILGIKTAVVDNDQRPYHFVFSMGDDQVTIYKSLFAVMSGALWISDELFEQTRELNLLIYSKAKDGADMIQFGKDNYTKIAELRTQIEKLHARDMLTLHKVPSFLRSKQPADSYVQLPARG
jgi:hypothetical protein